MLKNYHSSSSSSSTQLRMSYEPASAQRHRSECHVPVHSNLSRMLGSSSGLLLYTFFLLGSNHGSRGSSAQCG
jgi:hypothetical protein